MWNLWREWKAFMRYRQIVGMVYDAPEADRESLARMASSRPYQAIKAMLLSRLVMDASVNGSKSEEVPGLARAIGVLARCEQIRDEETRRLKGENPEAEITA